MRSEDAKAGTHTPTAYLRLLAVLEPDAFASLCLDQRPVQGQPWQVTRAYQESPELEWCGGSRCGSDTACGCPAWWGTVWGHRKAPWSPGPCTLFHTADMGMGWQSKEWRATAWGGEGKGCYRGRGHRRRSAAPAGPQRKRRSRGRRRGRRTAGGQKQAVRSRRSEAGGQKQVQREPPRTSGLAQ